VLPDAATPLQRRAQFSDKHRLMRYPFFGKVQFCVVVQQIDLLIFSRWGWLW